MACEMTDRGERRVLLASRSARRRDLLTRAGIPHEVIESTIDDSVLEPGRVAPGVWAAALAYLKAAAGASEVGEGIVLGADTICVVDSTIIGQPRDAEDARRMIVSMQNRVHEVITGVALVCGSDPQQRSLFFERAEVTLGTIDAGVLDAYIESGAWRGKAGGYNLVERLAEGWPVTYVGDPSTIVGLPVERVQRELSRFSCCEAAA